MLKIKELRKFKGQGMVSAVGEYTPSEFWEALDEIESLRQENNVLREECDFQRGLVLRQTKLNTKAITQAIRLREAIQRALDDEENGRGWGLDPTIYNYLREALKENRDE